MTRMRPIHICGPTMYDLSESRLVVRRMVRRDRQGGPIVLLTPLRECAEQGARWIELESVDVEPGSFGDHVEVAVLDLDEALVIMWHPTTGEEMRVQLPIQSGPCPY